MNGITKLTIMTLYLLDKATRSPVPKSFFARSILSLDPLTRNLLSAFILVLYGISALAILDMVGVL